MSGVPGSTEGLANALDAQWQRLVAWREHRKLQVAALQAKQNGVELPAPKRPDHITTVKKAVFDRLV